VPTISRKLATCELSFCDQIDHARYYF